MLEELHPGSDKLVEMLGFRNDEAGGGYITDAEGTWELFNVEEDGTEGDSVATGSYQFVEGTEGDYSAVVPGSSISELTLGLNRAKIVSVFEWEGDEDHEEGTDERSVYYDVTERGAD